MTPNEDDEDPVEFDDEDDGSEPVWGDSNSIVRA